MENEHIDRLKASGNFFVEEDIQLPGKWHAGFNYNIQVETTTITATSRKLKGNWTVEIVDNSLRLPRLFNPKKRK